MLPALFLAFWLWCDGILGHPCIQADPYASPTPVPTVAATSIPLATATPTPTPQPTPTDTPTIIATGTPSPIPTAVQLSLARTFWFHDPASVDSFLAQPTPFPSSAGISIGGYALTKKSQADLAHANGLSVLGGLTGSPGIYAPTGAQSIAFLEHNNLDPLIAQRVEGLYVDEPFGQALNDPRECGPGCFVAGQPLSVPAVAYLVAAYNQLFSYIKSAPGMSNVQVGICESVVDFHIKTIMAGLQADFVCMESYGASTPGMLKQIKFAVSGVRQVKTMMLVYGSYPLCEQLHWGLGAIDYVSLWNIDNFAPWIAGGGRAGVGPNELDPNWAARATAYVNGDTSFCPALLKQPSTDPYKVPLAGVEEQWIPGFPKGTVFVGVN